MAGNNYGFTCTFIKRGEQQAEPVAEKPEDDNKLTPDVSGDDSAKKVKEETTAVKKKSFRQLMAYKALIDTLKIGRDTVLNSISSDSPTLKNQVSALSSGVASALGTVAAFAANPILGAVSLAAQAASFGVQEAEFQRKVAWADYDREEYARRRGYTAYSRSRRY